MPETPYPMVPKGPDPASYISEVVMGFVSDVPSSARKQAADPRRAAQALTRAAARKAAMTSGSLAMAPGPLGLLTVLPDLVAVWKLQSQLVSDIAAVYGRSATLSKEQMLYCLFKHSASQVVRDMVVRAGERYLIKRASVGLLQQTAKRLGMQLSQKVIGSSASRFLPVLGAIGVGGYAYYDTSKVAATAMELFEKGVTYE
jgi:hypothetical protein